MRYWISVPGHYLTTRAIAAVFLSAAAISTVSQGAMGAPFGTIGGPADSLIRVFSQGGFCSTPSPGPVCVEAVGNLATNDYSPDPNALLIGGGVVNHAAGTLSGTFTASPQTNTAFSSDGELTMSARDRFTLVGQGAGNTVSITARFRVQGTIAFQGMPSLESAIVEALLSHAPNGWDPVHGGLVVSTGSGGILRTGFNPASNFFQVDIEAIDTFDVVVGDTFDLAYRMDLGGGTAGGVGQRSVDMNFGSTGSLSFDLGDGYSIVSELGFSTATVSEPSGLLLFTLTLASFGLVSRRRRAT